jgi:hypothetical protein
MMRRSPYLMPAALIVTGIGLFVAASCRAQYNDPQWSERLYGPQWVGKYSDADADAWFAQRANLLTPREGEQDAGIAIAGLGIGLVAVMANVKVRTWADIVALRSPLTCHEFKWSAILVWLSFVPSEWAFYIYTSVRGDYSPMGDIIMIPCAGVAVFGLIGLPLVLLGVKLATAGRSLPVRLWTRPVVRWQNPVSRGVFVVLLAAAAFLLLGLLQMPTIVPSAVATIYLLLCGRATSAQPANAPVEE